METENFSNFYYNNGADEICYIDNVAHSMARIIYQSLLPTPLKMFLFLYQ